MFLYDLLNDDTGKVHIKNVHSLKVILEQYRRDGAKYLQVLTDFDRTLTKHSSNGVPCPSTHAVLESNETFSAEYKEKTNKLRQKYYPLEMDPNICGEEKETLMVEWWSEAHRLLSEVNLERSHIQSVVRRSAVQFRAYFENFRQLLINKSIPMLVFSAGIGTIVEEVFSQKSLFKMQNIEIISNFLLFNEQGVHVGFKGPLIHTFNKGKTSQLNQSYFDRNAHRHNVILLGDTLGDVEMASNLDCNKFNIIKIGFLNDKVEQNRAFYVKEYDIVIEDPESMEYVFNLFSFLFDSKTDGHNGGKRPVEEEEEMKYSLGNENSSQSMNGLLTRYRSCPPTEDDLSIKENASSATPPCEDMYGPPSPR